MSDLHYLPVSLGEAMDKLSILDIKIDKILDSRKENVKIEYDLLYKLIYKDINKYNLYYKIIKIINLEIWELMNSIRDSEDFDQKYINLCRDCMILNDMRFRIKNKINYISNCELKEQKGYKVTRILFDLNNYDNTLDINNLIKPIKYYSILYDEIIIQTNEKDKLVFENEFIYDPTIKIILEPLNLENKKVFNFQNVKYLSLKYLYEYLEIDQKIIDNYLKNF